MTDAPTPLDPVERTVRSSATFTSFADALTWAIAEADVLDTPSMEISPTWVLTSGPVEPDAVYQVVVSGRERAPVILP